MVTPFVLNVLSLHPILTPFFLAAFEGLYNSFTEYLGPTRAVKLKGLWDSLSEARHVVFTKALSTEYKPYVQKYLSENAEGAVRILKKHELEPVEHLECLKDAWVHNMYQEKIFGAQSEVQRSSRGGIQRTRGHAVALINGTILTPPSGPRPYIHSPFYPYIHFDTNLLSLPLRCRHVRHRCTTCRSKA